MRMGEEERDRETVEQKLHFNDSRITRMSQISTFNGFSVLPERDRETTYIKLVQIPYRYVGAPICSPDTFGSIICVLGNYGIQCEPCNVFTMCPLILTSEFIAIMVTLI